MTPLPTVPTELGELLVAIGHAIARLQSYDCPNTAANLDRKTDQFLRYLNAPRST